jgi:acyl carrier protein
LNTVNDIKETLRDFILAAHLPGESRENLKDQTPLQTSGILDSLAVMGLVSFIEQRFQVDLDVYDTSPERFNKIADIAAAVVRKREAGMKAAGP